MAKRPPEPVRAETGFALGAGETTLTFAPAMGWPAVVRTTPVHVTRREAGCCALSGRANNPRKGNWIAKPRRIRSIAAAMLPDGFPHTRRAYCLATLRPLLSSQIKQTLALFCGWRNCSGRRWVLGAAGSEPRRTRHEGAPGLGIEARGNRQENWSGNVLRGMFHSRQIRSCLRGPLVQRMKCGQVWSASEEQDIPRSMMSKPSHRKK